MVFYFTSNVVTPTGFLYVGKDKVENEELIAYGVEEDFHVDKLSSAHVYLRIGEDQSFTWETIPQALVEDCAQLTKANSIEGNKKDNISIIYTPWINLKKDGSMAVGQVGFKDPRKVKRILIPQRENAVINRLNKTRVEKFPDFREEREQRLRNTRQKNRSAQLERRKEESRVAREHKEIAWQKEHAYDDIFNEDELEKSSNQERGEDFLDDFM